MIKITLNLVNKGLNSSFIHFILFYLISLSVSGQKNSLRFETFIGRSIQHYDVESKYSEVSYPRIEENNFRVDISYWFQNRLGVGLGLERQSYSLLFEDFSPNYLIFNGHGVLNTLVIPMNFFYRERLLQITPKQALNIIISPGISFGLNLKGIRNEPPQSGQQVPDPNNNANNFYYNYEYDYNQSSVFSTIDIAARLEYQVHNRYSLGFSVLYYKGIGKIGSLTANYHPEGEATRRVEVHNRGTQFSYGIYLSYDLLFNKSDSTKND